MSFLAAIPSILEAIGAISGIAGGISTTIEASKNAQLIDQQNKIAAQKLKHLYYLNNTYANNGSEYSDVSGAGSRAQPIGSYYNQPFYTQGPPARMYGS